MLNTLTVLEITHCWLSQFIPNSFAHIGFQLFKCSYASFSYNIRFFRSLLISLKKIFLFYPFSRKKKKQKINLKKCIHYNLV